MNKQLKECKANRRSKSKEIKEGGRSTPKIDARRQSRNYIAKEHQTGRPREHTKVGPRSKGATESESVGHRGKT
jgi:hypothetical protein